MQARSMTSCEIITRDLSYRYPGSDVDALDGVDLRFDEGAFYAVLGRNGSGKSTLARCLNALLPPGSGEVVSCGLDTSARENHRDIRKLIAMIFQDPDTQMVGITVEDEVAFGPENLGLEPEEIRRRVDTALEVVAIEPLRKRQPGRLSQGQKQLVAIAGALAMEPAFILSDESTSMLDYQARSRILELFLGLKRQGKGVVHVTHFLEEAALADRVVVLEEGRVSAIGSPREVLCDPERVRRWGLDPLPVTQVASELQLLGHLVPEEVLTVKELLDWLTS